MIARYLKGRLRSKENTKTVELTAKYGALDAETSDNLQALGYVDEIMHPRVGGRNARN